MLWKINDEIGEIFASVDQLSENMDGKSTFAMNIGRRKFDSQYTPLSDRDQLGLALIQMRDNLRQADMQLNEAQRIAAMGSWELTLSDGKMRVSEEFRKLVELSPTKEEINLNDMILQFPETCRDKISNFLEKQLPELGEIQFESNFIRRDGTLRVYQIHCRMQTEYKDLILKAVGICRDITEQREIEQAMLTNLDELQKSNHELDKFVYSVSHDLRAPLSSMLGVVEIVDEDATDPLLLEHLKLLKASISKLDGFILDILDYSRNARSEIKKEKVDVKALLNDVMNNLKFMGGNNRTVDIRIDVNLPDDFISDRSRLSIILNNLVSNAIRYQNPEIEKPFVNVKLDMSDTETHIIVRDNGIGISKELHDKVFDMFYRVSSRSEGSGLGLYIVKEAVEKLGGKITLHSVPGIGSEFCMRFPHETVN